MHTRELVTAYIALGGNLAGKWGNAQVTVQRALQALEHLPLSQRHIRHSALYRTAPHDSSGPDYINAVAQIQTQLCAPELLTALQAIEQSAGRQRPYPNAPRTLDLDILLYGSATIYSPQLTIPHPRMWQRAFVLYPLAEIAPELVSNAQRLGVAHQAVARLTTRADNAS